MSCRQQQQVNFGDGHAMMNGVAGGHAVMPLALDADADFEPQPRDRCNTWPLQKSIGDLGHTSPLIHEEIPEEGSLSGSNDNFEQSLPSHLPPPPHHLSPNQQHSSPSSLSPNQNGANAVSSTTANNAGGPKKNSARRNAWGNLSYADLITQAIMSSPEKRLTLSQIYDWMVQNVPYFRDKGDSNSSAGWKNSIRHNLSLHSRFVRIQNEGAGKSSWWVINPDAKPGKSSRRRTSTMPSGQDAVKASLEKKRRGVKKKIEQQRAALAAALGQGAGSNPGDLDGTDNGAGLLGDMNDTDFATSAPYHTLSPVEFRHRSDSNLSNYSSVGSRLSPAYEDLELFDWEAMTSVSAGNADSHRDLFNPTATDSGNDLAASMNLSMNLTSEPPPPYSVNSATPVNAAGGGAWRKPQQPRSGVSVSSSPLVHHQASPVKASPSSSTSSLARANGGYSPVGGVTAKSEPPSYQELYSVAPPSGPSSSNGATSNCASRANGGSHAVQLHLRNTLLIKKEAAAAMAHPCSMSATAPTTSAPTYGAMSGSDGEYNYYAPQLQNHHQPLQNHHHHQPHQNQPQFHHGMNMMTGGATYSTAPHQILPTELSDIQYDNTFKSDIQCDIDQVIRHELSIAGKIDFSIGDHFTNI